ncbi:hypothetical protein DID80_06965 [Candidatus Marinamargulisbacteria bacterium SCGC AAA071-K20]|nr:hypothetical protein DID80_06965 [Candidatus Marinamargulisbacteria bacterium SCGC AAA071-K20]
MRLQKTALYSEQKKEKPKKSRAGVWLIVCVLLIGLAKLSFGDMKQKVIQSSGQEFLVDTDVQYFLNIPINHEIIIGIIDTGVDYNHPLIQESMWENGDEVEGNGLDDDNNGYVDDIRGWNFANNTNDPIDIDGHGTHVAGIAAGKQSVENNFIGVNPSAKIMNLRIFDEDGNFTGANVADAIRYAVDNGAKIINCSFGASPGFIDEDIVKLALQYAIDNGVIVVAATANTSNNYVRYPEYYPGVITVSNLDILNGHLGHEDYYIYHSGYGSHVDFCAYGGNIYSLDLDNSFRRLTGTSMSSPLIAGAISRLLAYNNTLSKEQLYNLLADYSIQLSGSEGGKTVNGRIDFEALSKVNATTKETSVEVTIGSEKYVLVFDGSKDISTGQDYRLSLKYLNKEGQQYSIHQEIDL